MAKKNNLKARLSYDEEKDGYALEINTDGKWGLSRFFPCVRCFGQSVPEFIHYEVLIEVLRCLALGYEVEFLGRKIRG